MSIKEIKNLPDYYALKQLASSLWKKDGGYQGAAIMIGAGFSRSAARTGDESKKMPIWSDLSKKLAMNIGADTSRCVDALRLAEEYYAYHGKQALNDLLKLEVNDSAWEPTELYDTLLSLPWSEVLTTNWDTLLERAAKEIHEPIYATVHKQADLASSESPRIVKLHGTIEVTDNLIFTQEDYRKYPETHAAFVNFARHVFIENELCLLGFSGDDPNFLQWAGWVRDNLARDARRIYLVGALNLTVAKRKYLESLGVSPIDFSPMVARYDDRDKRHLKSIELFISFLHQQKPLQKWEWKPTSESSNRQENIHEKIKNFNLDRMTYPDWLLCPTHIRWHLSNSFISKQNIEELPKDKQFQLLYELIWRYKVSRSITPHWIVELILPVLDQKEEYLTQNQKLDLAVHLLNHSRWLSEEEEVIKFQTEILNWIEQHTEAESSHFNESNYQLALIARDNFDYEKLEMLVNNLFEDEPIWMLRKAGLMAELGEFSLGKELVEKAFKKLQHQHRNDKQSINILSKLAWAHWFYRVAAYDIGGELRKAPLSFKEAKTDPWDFIQDLRDKVQETLESQQKNEIEALFEAGAYFDHSNSMNFNNETHPLVLFFGMTETTGIPIWWDNFNLLGGISRKLALLDDIDNKHRFSLAIRTAHSDTDEVLKKTFTRISLAVIHQDVADYWINICSSAVRFWLKKLINGLPEQRNYALERLKVFIEVLGRLQIRATPATAMDSFRLGLEMGSMEACQHHWLFDSLNHLIKYSLDAIPANHKPSLFTDVLNFPLKRELQLSKNERWPNPVINSFPDEQTTEIKLRINEIIDLIAPCSNESSDSLIRLLPMLENGYLSVEQKNNILEKIWGDSPDYSNLPQTGLLNYVLLKLPNNNQEEVEKSVRKKLFEQDENSFFKTELFLDIVNAAENKITQLYPDHIQALNYFKRLVSWRAPDQNDSYFGMSQRGQNKELAAWIGKVLSYSVVPSLNQSDLTIECFEKLKNFYESVDGSSTSVIAFVYFAKKNSSLTDFVEKQLIRELQSQDHSAVAHSAHAILKWFQLTDRASTKKLLVRLIYLMASGKSIGLSSIIWTITEIYKLNGFENDEILMIINETKTIFVTSEYSRINPYSREAVTVSLIKKECISLAKAIVEKEPDKESDLEDIIENAAKDALPEVRFA